MHAGCNSQVITRVGRQRRLGLVVVSGYGQDGRARNGGLDLVDQLGELAHGNDVQLYYARWDDDPVHWARLLYHRNVDEVALHPYSYGGGWFAPRFTRALQREGIEVAYVSMSDGVHRFPIKLLNWRNIVPRWVPVPRPPIRFSPNVKRVHGFYQRTNQPSGDLVIADEPSLTRIEMTLVVGRKHEEMDNLDEWHELSVRLARELICKREAAL